MSGNTSTTRVPADLQRTLDRMYAATVTMGQGDPEPFIGLLSHADDVSLFGAWGPCKRGRDELSRTFRWVGSRFGGGDLHCEDTVVVVGQDLAYTVGYERAEAVVVDGGEPRPATIRVTQIYRLEDGEWRLVHRHGDFAPVDESAGRLAR